MSMRRAGSMVVVALLALVLAATAFVYWPGMDGGFIFDDLPNIVDNPEVQVHTLHWADWDTAMFSSPASPIQRPLAMLTFAVNHYFTRLDPRPMKITNLAIHLLNALLLFGLLRSVLRGFGGALPGEPGYALRQLRERAAALFATAAWALHPINLMAVLFIVQRMESLAHTFVFAGLWLYSSGRQQQMAGSGGWKRTLGGMGACMVLGLMVKESAVLLPLYALCLELCVFRFAAANPATRRQLHWLYLLGLALPAVLGLAWLLPLSLGHGAYDGRDFTLGERLLSECRVVMQYLSWCVYPNLDQLGLFHDDYLVSRGLLQPPTTALALAGILALPALAWWLLPRRPLVSLGLLWFLGAQLLTATFIPLELMFEHRNYFASAGICLALADLLILWPTSRSWRRIGAIVATLLLLLFAGGTWLRASEWDHPVRFVKSELAKHPQSPRATYELARMLVILSGYRPDSRYLQPAMEAIEAARRAPGSNVLPEQAALIVASRTGLPLHDDWWTGLEWKLRHQPVGQQALGALAALVDCANIHRCQFSPDRMLEVFSVAMSRGDNPELFNLYGSYALNSLRDPRLALAAWHESVRLKPSEPQYHINLARLLMAMRQYDQARVEIAALRAIGRLGQYESLALKLEASIPASAGAAPAPENPTRNE